MKTLRWPFIAAATVGACVVMLGAQVRRMLREPWFRIGQE